MAGDIAVVRMQDRQNRNMFTPAILQGLMASFAEIERNEAIKAVLVTGCDNVFSMGGTRDELMTLSDQVRNFADLEFIFKGFLQCRVPVIAAIQGHASGGGLVFGLYADIVLMAEEALYSAVLYKVRFYSWPGRDVYSSREIRRRASNRNDADRRDLSRCRSNAAWRECDFQASSVRSSTKLSSRRGL